MIERYAVRLEGLDWKWIRADRLGLSPRQLVKFGQALSKDAPHSLALALDMSNAIGDDAPGYLFVNADLTDIKSYPHELSIASGRGQGFRSGESWWHDSLLWLNQVYVPLGFALDIEQWQSEHDGVPKCNDCGSSRRETESYLNSCSNAGCRLNSPMTYHANCGSQERVWCTDCGAKLSDTADEPIEMRSVEYICQQCEAEGIQPGHFVCGESFSMPVTA